MNQGQFIKETVTKLSELKTTFEAGLPITSTVLNDCKTDLDAINTFTGNLAEAANTGLGSITSDLVFIGGNSCDAGAGNLGAGTQRMCIATDDVNLASIASNIANINTNIVPAYDPGNGRIQVDQQTLNGYVIDAGAGNLSAGTQRMCIATDDVLISDIDISTSRIAGCVDLVNHHVEVDTNAINGVTMAVNSGNNSTGVQRVCIATDDVNLANISAKLDSIYTILNDIWNSTNHYIRTHETA